MSQQSNTDTSFERQQQERIREVYRLERERDELRNRLLQLENIVRQKVLENAN